MYKSNNFSWRNNESRYLSQDEYKSRQEAIREEIEQGEDVDREVNKNHRVSWVSPASGKAIEVFVWSKQHIEVFVDGKRQAILERDECCFRAVPEKQLIQAKANGIVCKLGPLGVTAEQKAEIEAKLANL